MGVALGWVAFALAGVASAPSAELAKAQITYNVQMVETQGVGWREGVFTRLKPVTRQGSATVWTVPRDAAKQLLDEFSRCPNAKILAAPKVTALSGAPAAVQFRNNRPLVTQVAWSGQEAAAEAAPEHVRAGWHTTMVGRKLDQGVLVQVVFEDTVIRAVHQIKVDRPAEQACPAAANNQHQAETGSEKATGLTAIANAILGSAILATEPRANDMCAESQACCKSGEGAGKVDDVQKVVLDVPEIDTQEVLGEWLVPHGEVLLVSFGAHTVADEDGMAVVKERLAMIEADLAAGASFVIEPIGVPSAPVRVFAPQVTDPAPPPLVVSSPFPNKIPIMPVTPSPLVSVPAPLPQLPVPTPIMPSRSIPQGVRADGTPADLPPLPDDETESDSSSSESSEPMASPQTKRIPQPKAKPTTDSGANKAEFTLPKAASMFLPSLFMPSPSTGFQFLMPIKPLSLKLPFGQKLEVEVIGRVVADSEVR
jgi:hypothetical protein